MARGKKYHFSYATILETIHTVEIYVEGFEGVSEELDASATPIIEAKNKTVSVALMGGIAVTQYTIKAHSTPTFKANLFTSQSYGDVIIVHKTGATVDWNAILIPFESKDEDLGDGYFTVELQAECGLNYLKTSNYATTSTRVKIIDVIHNCISQIPAQTDFPYSVLCGVLASTDSIGTLTARYFETYINDEQFKDVSHYDTLTDLLQGFRELFFSNSRWWVRNVKELNSTNSVIYNYANDGSYIGLSAYNRPTASVTRTSGYFGKEYSHKNVIVTKNKSRSIERFAPGEFVDFAGWTKVGLATLLMDIEDGQLTNLGNTVSELSADTDPNYIVNTNGISYFPFRHVTDQTENDSATIRIKSFSGSAIKNLRFQIIANQVGLDYSYFLTSEGSWYRQDGYTGKTPLHLLGVNNSGEVTIKLPKPPYNDGTPLFNIAGEYGIFEGLNSLFPATGEIEYKLYVRVYLPEAYYLGEGGQARFSKIDYIRIGIEQLNSETFEGFVKDYGVSTYVDKQNKLDVNLSAGFPIYPQGTETLFVASTGTAHYTHFVNSSDEDYKSLEDFVAAAYLDVLSVRHRNFQGNLFAGIGYEELISIDGVKYRFHDYNYNPWDNVISGKLIELLNIEAEIIERATPFELSETVKAQILEYIKGNDSVFKESLFINENFEASFNNDGTRQITLKPTATYPNFLSRGGQMNLVKEDNEATSGLKFTNLLGATTDSINPVTEGFELKAENWDFDLTLDASALTNNVVGSFPALGVDFVIATNETAWMRNAGNTLTAKDYIGGSGAYDIGVKVNGVERMLFKSGGNIGIGVDPSTSKFTVIGQSAGKFQFDYNNTAVTYLDQNYFYVRNVAGSASTLIVKTADKRVGIGTDPNYNLDVVGNGHITGSFTFDTVPSSLQDATTSNHLVRYSQWIASTSVKYLPTAVKSVAFSNITLSGTQTINGVALVADDRVLLTGQTDSTKNGVWVVAAGAWTRATDSDTDAELRGFIVNISGGTYAGYKYINTNTTAITVNTTSITYAEFSNLAEIDPVFVGWRDETRTANTIFIAPDGSNGAASWRGIALGDISSAIGEWWTGKNLGTAAYIQKADGGGNLVNSIISESSGRITITGDALIDGSYFGSKGVTSNNGWGLNVFNVDEGTLNVAIGRNVLRYGVDAGNGGFRNFKGNTAIGADAMSEGVHEGEYNTAIGHLSMKKSATNYCSTAVGLRTLSEGVNVFYATAMGADALRDNLANDNSAFGAKSMLLNTTGTLNTGVGLSTLYHNLTGSYNAAGGALALFTNTASHHNAAFGYRALYNATGTGNAALGSRPLDSLTSGNYNTSSGYQAGFSQTTGSFNVYGGAFAGFNIVGSGSVFLGSYAAYNATTGGSNVVIGYQAGRYYNDQAGGTGNLTTLNQGIFIGNGAKSKLATSGNEIVIGNDCIGYGTNTASWGGTNITDHYFSGSLRQKGVLSKVLKADSTGKVIAATYRDFIESVTLGDDGDFKRIAHGLYLNQDPTDTSFFVGTDMETGMGIFRQKAYLPYSFLKTYEMSFELDTDRIRPYIYDADATNATKKYLAFTDELGEGGSEPQGLQSVTDVSDFSTKRLRFKSGSTYTNYALITDISAASTFNTVLANGSNALNKNLNLYAYVSSAPDAILSLNFGETTSPDINAGTKEIKGSLKFNVITSRLYLNGTFYNLDAVTNYANEAAAKDAGLVIGDLYRIGGTLTIVTT